MEPTISFLIEAVESGDRSAADALFTALYSRLRQVAKRELARHAGLVTLSPTTLLHETYLDMASSDSSLLSDQARFMSYAARVMRGLIIDHVRNRQAQKRGGRFEIMSIASDVPENAIDDRELARISDALDELAQAEPALAEIVDLKFFCGFTFAEIAGIRGLSERTVQRNWEKARIYLHDNIRADLPS